MTACAVLHVTSLHGGGVDRHVRDIARGVPRPHLVWHAAEATDVIEVAGEDHYFPLDRARLEADAAPLAAWLRGHGVGIVHAHSVSRAARKRVEWAARALAVPWLATLHDVLFLRREGFEPGAAQGPDPEWLRETSLFLRGACAVTAPSEFIAGMARRHVPELRVEVVPNGAAPAPAAPEAAARPEFAARRPRHVVAVLGAIGPHKGSDLLEALGAHLAGSGIAIVVIGYTDRQILAGWRNESLFVHGVYREEEAAALLRAYGAELVLFANPVPESFSYALSDAWNAGVPALVPPDGALAERVGRHGGGWLLPQGFGPDEVAASLERLLGPEAEAERARVKSQLALPDALRVPSLDAMNRSFDVLYARYGVSADARVDPSGEAMQHLLATQLDTALFRPELVQLSAALERERREAAEAIGNLRRWIDKLDADVAGLKEAIESANAARRTLEAENAALRSRGIAGFVRRVLKKIGHARS